MDFTLVLNLDNDAMLDSSAVNDALGKVMHAIAGLEFASGQGGAISDSNGNVVGHWEIVE